MADDFYFEKIKKTEAILFNSEKKFSKEYEERLCRLYELASYVCECIDDENFSFVKDICFKEKRLEFHSGILPENKSIVSYELGRLQNFDRAMLCEYLVGHWQKREKRALLSEELLNSLNFDSGYVSYVKNKYSDKAFDVLSLCIDEPKVVYAKNFLSVCEDIAHGFATYGILPISSSFGALETVKQLLASYELKICAVCEIQSADEEATRYALISDKLRVILDSANRRFAFSLFSKEVDTADKICEAINLYGLCLCDMNVSVAYSDRYNFNFTIKENNENLPKLILFLSLFYPDFVANGLYSEI